MSLVHFINKGNLRIARENMGISPQAASKKITTSGKDVVTEWEEGTSLPTWSQVTKLAALYNVPELLFFAKENLQKNKAIPDYRIGVDQKSDEKVKKLINLVVTRQKWIEKQLRDGGTPKNKLQGTGRHLSSPKQLAEFISEKLGINIAEMKEISARKDALDYLIEKAEEGGIFVGKTISYHHIKVDDMRGLFVSNDYCPFIVLNRKDTLSAQMFSFAHELAHFFRRSDAVSNSLDFRNTERNINPEEVFCNKVAAELLLPERDFVKDSYNKSDINAISDLYKVSPLSVFYRLKELGKIRNDLQSSLEREIQREMDENLRLKAEKDKAKSGGNYTNNMRDSNGSLYNRIVQNSYLENRIGYVEAANLLRFSPEMV